MVVAVQRGTQVAFDQVLERTTGDAPSTGHNRCTQHRRQRFLLDGGRGAVDESGYFASQYHGKGSCRVRSVKRYDSSLKTWMTRFHGVTTKYLANYLGWRRLLDRFKD